MRAAAGAVREGHLVSGIRRVAATIALCLGAGISAAAGAGELDVLDREPGNDYFAGDIALGTDGSIFGVTILDLRRGVGAAAYKLSPPRNPDGKWIRTRIARFGSRKEPYVTSGGFKVDRKGSLYGVSQRMGDDDKPQDWHVYRLSPSKKDNDPWVYEVIYSFSREQAGNYYLSLSSVADGVIYGVAPLGGSKRAGLVFQLVKSKRASGKWVYEEIHEFKDGSGLWPFSPLHRDRTGALYGTTDAGGAGGGGVIYRLSKTDSKWKYEVLYTFPENDDIYPEAADGDIVMDAAGGIIGTSHYGGVDDCGVAWRIAPTPGNKGAWRFTLLHEFVRHQWMDICQPNGVAPGPDGTFIGTTSGTVFQVKSSDAETEAWEVVTIHTFGEGEGDYPSSTPVLGADGALFGTNRANPSTIWKWTP
jgi:uncharacterized repeat protein (TIGR03803 family)